jgi:site-specific DNA-methyltransferase (adenine-specific)
MTPYYSHAGIEIYCGDCRELSDLWTCADVLMTDPPYGMSFVSSKTKRRPISGDESAAARDAALELWAGKPAILFGTWRVERPTGTRQLITWCKDSVGPGMGDLSLPWGCATEEIYVLGDGWVGKRRANFVQTIEQRGGTVGIAALLGHPTPKPTGLMSWLMSCAPAGVIADPFMGVGATLLAAKELGRRAVGIEIEERYCEIAARRLSQEILPGMNGNS